MKLSEAIDSLKNSPDSGDWISFVEAFPKKLERAETLQEAFEIDIEEMEKSYKQAFEHYNANRFDQALDLFKWLTLLNPFIEKFWLGVAGCQQLLKLFDQALHSYAICFLLNPENPYPHFHAYQCFKALGNEVDANLAAQKAKMLAASKPSFSSLKQYLASLKI